jgi:hypothetical protein
MKKCFISIAVLLLFCSNLFTTKVAAKEQDYTVAQILCPDRSTRGVSSETEQFFITRESKLQRLSKKAEEHYQSISLTKTGIATSKRQCIDGIVSECVAAKLKTTKLDYTVGLREKIRKEFTTIQAEMAAKKNELCTANVPTVTIMRSSN